MTQAPTAIEVSGVHKSFRFPAHRIQTVKERALHPFKSVEYTELKALQDVSFEIGAGQFVGIAGRNGSGKTTLLKLLASIYRADRGTIRVAGRIAPFIELGVGFNPELAAEDNVLLNGVMMGLTPRDARDRFERVIEFAELEEFVELKLKNYSSGMRVRLGFAMLLQADAEIFLIDEVLAVGDASFQQKCTDAFYDMREAGKTIVLVTHEMAKLRQYCDSAVLLHEGKVDRIGSAEAISERYLELNFRPRGHELAAEELPQGVYQASADGALRLVSFSLEDETGQPTDSFKHGEPIRFRAVIEAGEGLRGPCFGLEVLDPAGVRVFAIRARDVTGAEDSLQSGERVEVRGSVENPLSSGHYAVNLQLARNHSFEDVVQALPNAGDFIVYGAEAPEDSSGVISPRHELRIEREPTQEPVTR
jgi:ABC-2 type transport system ATP-binding protein